MHFERPPTHFPELNSVLGHLVDGVREVLGSNFVGAYLQGSFALGDADENSDVDWIVVTHDDIPASELPRLDVTHKQLHARPETWAQHLEGSYFPERIFKSLAGAPTEVSGAPREPGSIDPHTGAPPTVYPLLYLNNGSNSLARSQHDNTLVARWILREHGVTLFGPSPQTLIDPVVPADLAEESLAVMKRFGEDLLTGAAKIEALWLQGFVVLFYCRVLGSVATGTILSKPAAASWAKANLDPRWHSLIEGAWTQRARYPRGQGAPSRHAALRPDPADVAETLEFVRDALAVADRG